MTRYTYGQYLNLNNLFKGCYSSGAYEAPSVDTNVPMDGVETNGTTNEKTPAEGSSNITVAVIVSVICYLIVVITITSYCYCKKEEVTEDDNPVYDSWSYYSSRQSYVKDNNDYYQK